MNTSRPPPFWELMAFPFQELCRDMLREDPTVKGCNIYGKNGQGQFGIDLEAPLRAGGCWTGQCKAQENFSRKDLRDAADEFWKHRARWKARGAKRFIVLVGCGVEDTKVRDEERAQRERFEREGIEFDLWDSRELRNRLCPHWQIVRRYCPVVWAEIICGTASGGVAVAAAPGECPSALALPLMDEISGLRDQRLTDIRELIRAGKELSAERELEEMCSTPSWESLAPKVRARAMRQRIGLMLGRRQDVEGARTLLAEAKAIAPGASLKVPEALIAYHSAGAAAALAILEPAGDVDEWNLYLALLLNLGRATDVLKELDAPRFHLDAETWRLRAVALLATRNVAGARLAIQSALALSPSWRRLNEAAAVIDYYSALSPAVDARLNFEWPTPPDWQFVRRDDESVAALRRAAEQFSKLAAAAEITAAERKGLEVWHLAALANDPSRENEAAALAQTLLEREPGHIRVAIWASHRGYNFDQASVRAALERECSREPATIEPVQALFALLVNENEVAVAGGLLDAHRTLFEKRRAMGIWRFERAQAWMAVDEKEKASALLAEETDEEERRKTEAALARVEAARGGSRATVATIFRQRFAETNADADLFASCEAHLFGGLPDYVASHAAELVRRIGTESALRLALDGSFAAKKYEFCLELLDRNIGLFPEQNPPPVVHRLRVECLRRSGRLVEAQCAAEILAREAGESMDLFAVFETQRAAGDMSAAAMTARRLLSSPDITSEGLLHLSMHLRVDAPEIAKEAFEKVLRSGVQTAQQAAVATQVGFALGFDDQLGPVIAQALATAGQPGAPLVPVSISEWLEMMAESRDTREKNAAAYGRGEMPVHLYAPTHQIPLVALFRWALLLNQSAGLPFGSFATMIRHGSRDEPRTVCRKKDSRLFLDVTSYLLAGHLDVLEAIEGEFAPVQVSPHLPASLQEQLSMLAREQVTRQPPRAEVLALIAEQRIALVESTGTEQSTVAELQTRMGERWCGLLAHAERNGGYLVDFLPLRSNDPAMEPVQVPPEVQARLRSTGDLVHALKQNGALTAEEYDLALRRLGSEGGVFSAQTLLAPDSFVVLEPSSAENLAYAGVLRTLAHRCRVAIATEEHRRLLSETESRQERMAHAAWLRQLRDRLRRGLQDGRYETKASAENRDQHANFSDTAEGRCLWDLLDKTRAADIWTCCDDRFVGRFERVGESRVVDVFDLLHELHRRKKLPAEALFSHLAHLRAGNARYLPITPEEVVHQLQRAEVGVKGVIETPELATLRRYVAACVLDTERLQRPPPNHPKLREVTEIKCIMTFYSAGLEALTQLWKDKSLPTAKLMAMSDWLLHQFVFDAGAAVEMWSAGNAAPALDDMAGLSDANLFFRAIALGGRNQSDAEGNPSRQRLYVRWLMSRLEPDSLRLERMGRHLHQTLLAPVRKARSKKGRLIAALTCGELYMAFPQELQRATGLKKADLAALSLEQWQPMTLGKYSFDLGDFWRASERAHRRGSASITARVPTGMKFSVHGQWEDGWPVVILDSAEAKGQMRVSDKALGLVQSDAGKREASMFAERRWMDLSQFEADRVFPRIARIKNTHERLRQYYEVRENSLTLHFGSLTDRFTTQSETKPADLRPLSPQAILKHLRLPQKLANGALRVSLETAVETLLAEEGFEETFVRLAALPVALPSALVSAFAGLEISRREKWREQAIRQIKTPIMRLHLARLLLDGGEEEVQAAVELLCGFATDDGSECFDAFEAVFCWTYREVISSCDADLPDATILTAAWSYAARLHQLLSGYVEQAEIVRSLEEGAKPRPRELLRPRQTIWLDVSGPQLIGNVTLAVGGAASILERRTLGPELREKLGVAFRKLCFPFAESAVLPALPLLRIRATQSNALGSFFAERRHDILGHYIGAEDAKRFSEDQIHEEIDRIIARLTSAPNSKDDWVNATAFMGAHMPPANLQDKFRRCLLATDWTHFAELNEPTRQGILLFLTSQAANFIDDELHGHFRLQLSALARRFAATCKDRLTIEIAAHLLANAAHFLAISRGDEPTRAEALVSILDEISEAWPGAAKDIWRLNFTLLLRQPAATVSKLWPLIFRLRATSARLED